MSPQRPSTARRAAVQVGDAIVRFIGDVPSSNLGPSRTPAIAAKGLANKAAASAAVAAGTLALPPGPLGWLTILPEMIAVWKIQAQLVADVAALYGKEAALSREQMMYCLFRHSASQAVRDLVVRAGERVLVRRATMTGLQAVARRVGIRVTQHSIGRGVARLMPIIGAVGVGGYAYYDTARVAKTAMELYSREIATEEP